MQLTHQPLCEVSKVKIGSKELKEIREESGHENDYLINNKEEEAESRRAYEGDDLVLRQR